MTNDIGSASISSTAVQKPPRLAETGLWYRQVAQDLLAEVAKVPGEARAIAEANSATLRFAAGSGSKRARSNSTPARPYICRFSILRRLRCSTVRSPPLPLR